MEAVVKESGLSTEETVKMMYGLPTMFDPGEAYAMADLLEKQTKQETKELFNSIEIFLKENLKNKNEEIIIPAFTKNSLINNLDKTKNDLIFSEIINNENFINELKNIFLKKNNDQENFIKEINRIEKLEERNRRVEADKAWETSWMRKFSIMILTYIVVLFYMLIITKTSKPYINALVPVLGFGLSTITINYIKTLWIRHKSR